MLVTTSEIGKAYITDCIDDVRSKLASAINKAGNTVTSDKLGIDAILDFMRKESENQRMTKDAIGAWFDADLSGLIAEQIAIKYEGIAQDKIDAYLANYRAQFQTLAGRDVSMNDDIKAALMRVTDYLPEDYDSVIGGKVIEALSKVSSAKAVEFAL